MVIRITRYIPVRPQPKLGKEYKVVRIVSGGSHLYTMYYLCCEGQEVGVLGREVEVIEGCKEGMGCIM